MDLKLPESIATHFTRLRGSSFPVKRRLINQPFISQVCIELEDEGKSDATINRVVSAVSQYSTTVRIRWID